MEIKFEQQGLLYVAEFEVASNCNLHIERESRGAFTIAQRGTKQGKYAYISDENYDDRTIIDVDMLGNIYPKYIKITSASRPTYAEVNFAEQGGGSGGGEYEDPNSEYYIEYLDFTNVEMSETIEGLSHIFAFVVFALTAKAVTDSGIGTIPQFSALNIAEGTPEKIIGLSLMPNLKMMNELTGIGSFKEVLELMPELKVLYDQAQKITKEEFFNTNV